MTEHPGPLVVGTVVDGERHLDLTGPEPFSPDQLFQIGSVTKTFTALLLARRLVTGELTYDTPVAELLPAASALRAEEPVSVGELATHTSGLPRIPASLWRRALTFDDDPYRAYGEGRLAGDLARVRLRRRGRSRYSNLGMGLLGHALAHAAGTTFHDLVRSEVCEPLGLVDTTGEPTGAQPARLATGHRRRGRPREVAWEFDALAGAGSLWSTGNDVLTYLQAHLAPPEGPLGAALRRVLEDPVLAWQALPHGRHRGMWWHNGGTAGFRSMVVLDPARNQASVALAAIDRGVEALALHALGRD